MVEKYVLEINGKDFTKYVERDSYNTELIPVTTETVTTLDGIDHVGLIRAKGRLNLSFNPLPAEINAELSAELLRWPLEVKYHCLQRNIDVYAKMKPDSLSANHLSYCHYMGGKWVQIGDIGLEEL